MYITFISVLWITVYFNLNINKLIWFIKKCIYKNFWGGSFQFYTLGEKLFTYCLFFLANQSKESLISRLISWFVSNLGEI